MEKDKSLSAGIGAVIASFLFAGGSFLIYFFAIRGRELHIIDAILLWMSGIIFSLGAIYLFIWGIVITIYNIKLFRRKLSLPNKGNAVFINTNPLSGLLALVISIVFTLTIIFFLNPMYKEGRVELVGILFFIISDMLLFIYFLFVLLYNIIKRNK